MGSAMDSPSGTPLSGSPGHPEPNSLEYHIPAPRAPSLYCSPSSNLTPSQQIDYTYVWSADRLHLCMVCRAYAYPGQTFNLYLTRRKEQLASARLIHLIRFGALPQRLQNYNSPGPDPRNQAAVSPGIIVPVCSPGANRLISNNLAAKYPLEQQI